MLRNACAWLLAGFLGLLTMAAFFGAAALFCLAWKVLCEWVGPVGLLVFVGACLLVMLWQLGSIVVMIAKEWYPEIRGWLKWMERR
jgi:hypothetical protein